MTKFLLALQYSSTSLQLRASEKNGICKDHLYATQIRQAEFQVTRIIMINYLETLEVVRVFYNCLHYCPLFACLFPDLLYSITLS